VLVDAEVLRRFKIFEELDNRELETIAQAAKTEELGEGTRLTEAGFAATTLYLIMEGRVTVLVRDAKGHNVAVDELGPGQILGWSTLVGPYIYTASGVAAEKLKVITFNGSKLRQIFEINNHIGYRVLKGMGNVISKRIAAIENKRAEE
jgi:CRP/FNR family transcriptional regulator, cyclic AMP receptor protein